jgi:hypothetical protein
MIPDASVLLILALVLAHAFLFDRLVFRPVLGMIKKNRHQPRRSSLCICR